MRFSSWTAIKKQCEGSLRTYRRLVSKCPPFERQCSLVGLTAIEAFGAVVGAQESLIIDPVDGTIPAYKSLGYQLKFGGKRVGRYMSKSLK